MKATRWICATAMWLGGIAAPMLLATDVVGQGAGIVIPVDLPVGRSFPITTPIAISRVSVANPEVADVAVISERELVINAKATGETDAIVWQTDGARIHYRILVRSPSDRMQLVVGIKFAEVRRDLLRDLGVAGLYRDATTRVGTGIFRGGSGLTADPGVILPAEGQFLSVLTNFDTSRLLAFLEAQEQRGHARTLAEPTVMAANKEEANFLAGGELPIPIAQSGAGDLAGIRVTVQYKTFGIHLRFVGEIISDSLIKLTLRPEVSSLDYGNAVLISGFRIPAFRTRRVETTLDVRRNESLVISGLFSDERQRVRTGIPGLMDIPILGLLFSSTRWQRNESELLVVVTPVVIDPMRPRPQDVLPIRPDTTRPALEALEKRLPPAPPPPPPANLPPQSGERPRG